MCSFPALPLLFLHDAICTLEIVSLIKQPTTVSSFLPTLRKQYEKTTNYETLESFANVATSHRWQCQQ